MKNNEQKKEVYEKPVVEEFKICWTISLLTGSTAPDSSYTDGGDGWS
ncbi:MAG: hypothetical protein LKI59_03050 [Bacteroidales bacterium]|jgi:hypothetical protein|nr:hypothetical protein [Bacteroidales bacterium]